MMIRISSWLLILFCSFSFNPLPSLALVTYVKYTSLCSVNVNLSRPNEVFQIDFDLASELNGTEPKNCFSTIKWTGFSQFRLIPHVVETGRILDDNENDQKKIVLDIHDTSGVMFELKMFGPKAFFLAMIPTKKMNSNRFICPKDFYPCNINYCIHRELICDGTVQCLAHENVCFESPTTEFLVFSFLAVISACFSICLILFLYIYFRYYYNQIDEKLLPTDYRPKLYGAVNSSMDSFTSDESLSYQK